MKKVLLISAFLTGFSAIALEVLWTRVLVMVVGGSTYAFTVVLIAFLVGIAVGSLVAAGVMHANKKDIRIHSENSNSHIISITVFTLLQILLGASVIFTIPALGELPFVFLEGFRDSIPAFGSLMFHETFLALRVILLPTLLMGIAFPLLIRIYSQNYNSDSISMSVGNLYAVNTIGGVLGSLVGGFILIPTIGVQRGILGMGIVYLMIGVFVYANVMRMKIVRMNSNKNISIHSQNWYSHVISILVLFVTLITILIGFSFSSWEKGLLSSGFYKDPTLYLGKTKEELLKQLKSNRILYSSEGISAHVSVTRSKDGILSLKINGKADASTGSDMENQLLLGHLPMLLHKDPKKVLVVGIGSGITLGSVLSHPVKHVDAVEIEEKVVEAARFFNKYSNNALEDPRVRLIVGDGRNFLLARTYLKTSIPHPNPLPKGEGTFISPYPRGEGTPFSPSPSRERAGVRGYDVITSEPSNPWLSGSSKLFTKEYFELYKKSIKDDGVVVHWINFHSIDQESLKRVLRAYVDVFPHVAGFGVPASNDLLLVGSKKPIVFDYQLLVERMGPHPNPLPKGEGTPFSPSPSGERAGVRADLAKIGIKEPFEILSYFVLGEKEVKKIVGNAPANTDNYPYVEFSAPKYLYTSVSVNPWRVILENLSPIETIVSSVIATPSETRGKQSQSDGIASSPLDKLGAPRNDKEWLRKADKFRKARLLTQVYSIEKNIGEGIKEGEKALKIDPDNIFIKEKLAQFYFEEGTSFFNQSQYSKAVTSLNKSIEIKKTSEAYFNLGQTYGWDGNLEKARENYEKAVSLDPEFEQGWMWLGDTASQLGDLNGAISSYQKVVGLNPKNLEAHVRLGNLYILRRDFGRAEEHLDRVFELDPVNEKAVELMKSIP